MSARPAIENSDRGITLNKSLAWTILVALVSLVWWGGATITNLQGTTMDIRRLIDAEKLAADGRETRIRNLEMATSSDRSTLASVQRDVARLLTGQEETNRLLRDAIIAAGSR
jgi:hypothetical protein